jgi:SAM-dependent MidA family methyltransferase
VSDPKVVRLTETDHGKTSGERYHELLLTVKNLIHECEIGEVFKTMVMENSSEAKNSIVDSSRLTA